MHYFICPWPLLGITVVPITGNLPLFNKNCAFLYGFVPIRVWVGMGRDDGSSRAEPICHASTSDTHPTYIWSTDFFFFLVLYILYFILSVVALAILAIWILKFGQIWVWPPECTMLLTHIRHIYTSVTHARNTSWGQNTVIYNSFDLFQFSPKTCH